MEALERAGHVGTRLALALDRVADVSLLELLADAFGIPVLDAEADVPDRGRRAIHRLRQRFRGGGITAILGADGGIAANDRAPDVADLYRGLPAVTRTHVPS